jgi:hypothetical protein
MAKREVLRVAQDDNFLYARVMGCAGEREVPPLRFASVGMTLLLIGSHLGGDGEFSFS